MYPACSVALGVCFVCPDVTVYPEATAYSYGACPTAPSAPHTVTLKLNSTLTGYESQYARIVVTGNNVWLKNVTVDYPIYVTGEAALNVSFTNVTCATCESAVVVTGSTTTRHGAVPVDISLQHVAGKAYAAALAHTSGKVKCTSPAKVLLQPVGSAVTVAPGCTVTDLGALLSIYGDPYLLRFFDGPPHKIGALLFAVKIMTIVTASLLVVAYLSAYHVWQKFKDDRIRNARKLRQE